MGTGKTSWAIQEMDSHPEESYIFATPFLDEIKRIKDGTNRHFCDPQRINGKKINGFNHLLACGKDIALTHCTFSNANEETFSYLEQGNYTLILDEVIDVLIEFNEVTSEKLKKDDPNVLISKKFISVEPDGKVIWITDSNKHAAYSEVERLAKSGNLFMINDTFMLWRFPPQIFSMFKKVYVLTYLFEGSFLKPYFESHCLDYKRVSVCSDESGHYFLCPYSRENEHREHFKELIEICSRSGMNNYARKLLSKSWYQRATNEIKAVLKNDIANFIKNIAQAKAADIMWTVPKAQEKNFEGKGYTTIFRVTKEMPYLYCPECNEKISHLHKRCPKCNYEIKIDAQWLEDELRKLKKQSKCYVPCNARATNDYQDRWALVYACNMFPNKYNVRYFEYRQKTNGIKVDVNEDYFALSCMLQWIWRSRIRKGEPIKIYIPSVRMRRLLTDWLNNKI